jgi:hypothetical protein
MFCPNPECPDRSETGHPSEYRDDVQTCPVCGSRLQHGRWEDLEATGPAMRPRAGDAGAADVELLRTRSLQEAEFVASVLDEEGIPCQRRLEGPDGSVLAGGVAVMVDRMEQILLVPETHLHRARILVEEVTRAEPVFDEEGATEEAETGGDTGEEAGRGGIVALVIRVLVVALLVLGFVAVLRMVFGSG